MIAIPGVSRVRGRLSGRLVPSLLAALLLAGLLANYRWVPEPWAYAVALALMGLGAGLVVHLENRRSGRPPHALPAVPARLVRPLPPPEASGGRTSMVAPLPRRTPNRIPHLVPPVRVRPDLFPADDARPSAGTPRSAAERGAGVSSPRPSG